MQVCRTVAEENAARKDRLATFLSQVMFQSYSTFTLVYCVDLLAKLVCVCIIFPYTSLKLAWMLISIACWICRIIAANVLQLLLHCTNTIHWHLVILLATVVLLRVLRRRVSPAVAFLCPDASVCVQCLSLHANIEYKVLNCAGTAASAAAAHPGLIACGVVVLK